MCSCPPPWGLPHPRPNAFSRLALTAHKVLSIRGQFDEAVEVGDRPSDPNDGFCSLAAVH